MDTQARVQPFQKVMMSLGRLSGDTEDQISLRLGSWFGAVTSDIDGQTCQHRGITRADLEDIMTSVTPLPP